MERIDDEEETAEVSVVRVSLYDMIANHRDEKDRRVITPLGEGYLFQIFADRVGVVLDSDPKRAVFFTPSDILQAQL